MSLKLVSEATELEYQRLLDDERILEMGRELDALLAEADDLTVELQWSSPRDKALHDLLSQRLEVIAEFRKILDALIRSAK